MQEILLLVFIESEIFSEHESLVPILSKGSENTKRKMLRNTEELAQFWEAQSTL